MKRFVSILLATVMVIVLLAGCAHKEETLGSEMERNEIVAALAHIPNNLDFPDMMGTALLTMTPYIYERVLSLDKEGTLHPGLAHSWERVDELTWNFEINEGHLFSNGDEVKMDDVVYSIERCRDIPKVASYMKNIESVTYEGRTLTVKLKEPNITTIIYMMSQYGTIVNKAYIDEHGENAILNAECGSGPYKVTEYIPGEKVVLEARDDYPFEKPSIKKMTFKQYSEPSARYIALETGEVQFATELSYSDFKLAEANSKFTAQSQVAMGLMFLSLNTTKEPFNNQNVRLAMAYAMDRESFSTVTEGVTPLYTAISGGFPKGSQKPANAVEHDLEKAKKLLEAEGYNESNPLTFDLQVYLNSPGIEAYQATLKSIGVNANIKMYEKETLISMIGSLDGQMDLLSLYASPTPLFEAGAYQNGDMRNFSKFENDEMNSLILKAKASDTEEEIYKYINQANELAQVHMPLIPICSLMLYSAWDAELEGVLVMNNCSSSFLNAYYK